jgi:hypothetical protein
MQRSAAGATDKREMAQACGKMTRAENTTQMCAECVTLAHKLASYVSSADRVGSSSHPTFLDPGELEVVEQ